MAFKSDIAQCIWPAVPSAAGAQALAAQYQLEASQYLTPGELRQAAFGQLQLVLEDAYRNIAHWRQMLERVHIARAAIDRGLSLPRLKQLRTFGEVLSEETRELCKRAWGVGIADIYSSEETGYIALQCLTAAIASSRRICWLRSSANRVIPA